jgi:transposase
MEAATQTRSRGIDSVAESACDTPDFSPLAAHGKEPASPVESRTSVLSSYRAKLARQDATIASLEKKIRLLEERYRLAMQRKYGRSTEQAWAQGRLFDEAEAEADESSEPEIRQATTPVKAHRRQRQRITVAANLPREERVHDLPEEAKVCPHDGTPLTPISSEDSEQLEYIPAQVKVIRHKRLTYACPCCHQYLVTADKPAPPIAKSLASASLLAGVAVHKYADGLPLYRQDAMFQRLGIGIGRTNLAHWMVQAGRLVQPILNLLGDKLAEQPVVHMDETPVQVLHEPGKTPQSQSYMWVRASGGTQPVRLFHYAPTRAQSVPLALLDRDIAVLMVDGYEGYQRACEDYGIVRLGCWAHARRKFVDAQRMQPKGKAGKADQALAHIAKLYRIESDCRDGPPDKRYRQRQQYAIPILDQLKAWLDKNLPRTAPKSTLGKALAYLHHQWPRLLRYLEDGRYPIDNNPAENAIRPFAVGRRNWLFCDSQAGAHASANLYSLVETAKANDLNPHKYLEHLFTELPNAQSIEDVEALLPWHLKASLT